MLEIINSFIVEYNRQGYGFRLHLESCEMPLDRIYDTMPVALLLPGTVGHDVRIYRRLK